MRVIGNFQRGNPPSLANRQSFPLTLVGGLTDLWAVNAASCGLADGTVYHYWFEVTDSSPFGDGRLSAVCATIVNDSYSEVVVSLRTSAPAPETLSGELRIYAVLRERLLAEMPDLDEETLADTLEGMTTLHELLAGLIRSALTEEALAEGLKARIGEMKGRLERLQARAARKRDLAHAAMTQAGIHKFTAPDFSAGAATGQPKPGDRPGCRGPGRLLAAAGSQARQTHAARRRQERPHDRRRHLGAAPHATQRQEQVTCHSMTSSARR